MISARRILTIIGTLFTALAAGFMMQYIISAPTDGAPSQGVQVASVAGVTTSPLTDAVVEDDLLIDAPSLNTAADASGVGALGGGSAGQEGLITVASRSGDTVGTVVTRGEPFDQGSCGVKTVAMTSAAAMVALNIDAVCLPNEIFTVHHNGMMVSGTTDTAGLASLMLPALSQNAVYIVTFVSGETAVAEAEVTSVPDYDRAIIQWSELGGLEVHALEYGASYNEPGHVWSGAMGDLAVAAKGEGGFMMRLGRTTALKTNLAEVYTFPTGTALNEGIVELSLEAMVTEENCGRDLEAQIIQKAGDTPMRARDLILAMPDCDAVGDFIVLKNAFDDLNIARN